MKQTALQRTMTGFALAGLLLLGLLAGCGTPQDDAVPQGGETPPAPSDAAAGDGFPEAATDVPATPEGNEEEAPPEDEPPVAPQVPDDEREAAAGEPAKTHYMNRNYFVKPVEEDGDKRVVLLTFDDGPKDADMLASILDTLDRHDARAIFFVNGFRVRQNPELLQLIDQRGHAVGNHSYDHIVLKHEPEDVIDRQLSDVQAIVEETIGKAPRFFRPPNGAGNDYIREKAAELGMLYMNWSNGSLDWADNRNDPDGVIRSVMDQLHPGSIILMHELSWTAEALDELLTRIRAEGYAFLDPHALEEEAR